MPIALNADMEWKSDNVSFALPAGAPSTYYYTNPNGENINFVTVYFYFITGPSNHDQPEPIQTFVIGKP